MNSITPTVVDSNYLSAVSDALPLTTESVVTMYVTAISGNHYNHRTVIQMSPDGEAWEDTEYVVNGIGTVTMTEFAAMEVRGRVKEVERTASSAKIHLIAN